MFLTREELGVDPVVFGPRGLDRAGKGEDVFRIETAVGGWAGGVPFPAGFDGFSGVLADEGAGVELVRGTTNVFEAPVEGLNTAVVVRGPAAVLVAADFAFEPMHEK